MQNTRSGEFLEKCEICDKKIMRNKKRNPKKMCSSKCTVKNLQKKLIVYKAKKKLLMKKY